MKRAYISIALLILLTVCVGINNLKLKNLSNDSICDLYKVRDSALQNKDNALELMEQYEKKCERNNKYLFTVIYHEEVDNIMECVSRSKAYLSTGDINLFINEADMLCAYIRHIREQSACTIANII